MVDSDEYGIYLERAAHDCLLEYYIDGGTATMAERIKWSRDVVEVLEYVHRNNVRHADVSGRNLLLDSARNVLLCDFDGSSVDIDMAIVIAGAGYRHPDRDEFLLPNMRSELHSLESTIYETETCAKLHKGLEGMK